MLGHCRLSTFQMNCRELPLFFRYPAIPSSVTTGWRPTGSWDGVLHFFNVFFSINYEGSISGSLSWVVAGEYTTSSPHHKVRWGCASTTLIGNLSLAKGMNFKSNVNQSSMIQHVSTIKKKSWLHHLVVETPWIHRVLPPHSPHASVWENFRIQQHWTRLQSACHSCQCRDVSQTYSIIGDTQIPRILRP